VNVDGIKNMAMKHGYLLKPQDIRGAILRLKSGQSPLVRLPFEKSEPSTPLCIRKEIKSEIYLGHFQSPKGEHYVILGSDGGIPKDGLKGYLVVYYNTPLYRHFLEGEGESVGHSPNDAHYCYNGRMTVIGITM